MTLDGPVEERKLGRREVKSLAYLDVKNWNSKCRNVKNREIISGMVEVLPETEIGYCLQTDPKKLDAVMESDVIHPFKKLDAYALLMQKSCSSSRSHY